MHLAIRPAPDRPRAALRRGLRSAFLASLLLAVAAVPAQAWDARTIEGTEAERRNTTTQPPPAGDQCSLGAPDEVPGLYEFSWACYAHDVCYQNHQLNGEMHTRERCDAIMLAKMDAECRSRHAAGSARRVACLGAGDAYHRVVRAVGLPAWLSWNGPPEGRGPSRDALAVASAVPQPGARLGAATSASSVARAPRSRSEASAHR